jgi:hypothetical protein
VSCGNVPQRRLTVASGTALRQVSGSSGGTLGGKIVFRVGCSRRVSVVGLHLPPSRRAVSCAGESRPSHPPCAPGGQSECAVGDLTTCERPILPNSGRCIHDDYSPLVMRIRRSTGDAEGHPRAAQHRTTRAERLIRTAESMTVAVGEPPRSVVATRVLGEADHLASVVDGVGEAYGASLEGAEIGYRRVP